METWQITRHELFDQLGIRAKEILDIGILDAEANWDEPAISITVKPIDDDAGD